jgi:protoporphyrinogen oxidase
MGGKAGYNSSFGYPKNGLDHFFRRLAADCKINYDACVVRIDASNRYLYLSDGRRLAYRMLYSTLPLNKALQLAGIQTGVEPDPAIAVEVLNIGARRGKHCPLDHWVYVPQSRSGFHRVGFYSNVSDDFLPASVRHGCTHVGLYVERCMKELESDDEAEIVRRTTATIEELVAWGFIESVEVVDRSFVKYAYTWSWIDSRWKEIAIRLLKEVGIVQAGRYGRWTFQGMLDSLLEGQRLGREIAEHAC